jgi:hypothetical protein
MPSLSQIDAVVANCSKEEGDRICRMVVELARAIVKDRTISEPHRPAPEHVHTSPVYREYERLIDMPKAS